MIHKKEKEPCSYCGKHVHDSEDVVCDEFSQDHPLPYSICDDIPGETAESVLIGQLWSEISEKDSKIAAYEVEIFNLKEVLRASKVDIQNLENKLKEESFRNKSITTKYYNMRKNTDDNKVMSRDFEFVLKKVMEMSMKDSNSYKLISKVLAKYGDG